MTGLSSIASMLPAALAAGGVRARRVVAAWGDVHVRSINRYGVQARNDVDRPAGGGVLHGPVCRANPRPERRPARGAWFTWCRSNGLDPLVGIQRAHVELNLLS